MKNIARRFLVVMLTLVAGLSCIGCTEGNAQTNPNAPDYSDSTLQMDFYGYSPPTDGTYNLDGETFTTGEDYRTAARYEEYMDCGMTILLAQSSGGWNANDVWETSKAKKVLDAAYEAGLDRVILVDYRIQNLSRSEESLIGEGKQFGSEAELDAYIEDCMAPYIDHPAMYGMQLVDEPRYMLFDAIGEVYRSIKRVAPQLFVQCNLYPLDTDPSSLTFYPETSTNNVYERYEAYVNQYIDTVGMDYVMVDSYPMMASNIKMQHIRGLQIIAEICAQRGLKFFLVSQTCEIYRSGSLYLRRVYENDMYWQTNLALGLGVSQLSYFTYWNKQDNNTMGEVFTNGTAIMTREGVKTELYYALQDIHSEIQQLAPTILNFKYSSSTYETKTPTNYTTSYLASATKGDLEYVTDIEVDKESVFVSELKDEDKGYTMYMVMNIINPTHTEGDGSNTRQTTTLTFDSQFKHAAVFDKGERTDVDLENGKLTVTLDPGHARFVIPY